MREDENSNEGRATQFYEDLGVRSFDPPVFDLLMAMRDRDERDVRVIEQSLLLPNTRFYSPILTDYADQRRDYFTNFFQKAKGRELVCFDPDTGIQGKTTPRRGIDPSSRYIMRDEAKTAFTRGHSLLIFVYKMRRETNEGFMARASRNLKPVEGATGFYAFRYLSAGFLLVPQRGKENEYEGIAKKAREDFPGLKVLHKELQQSHNNQRTGVSV